MMGCLLVDLAPKAGYRTYKEILRDIRFNEQVEDLIAPNVEKATMHREWEVISRDATYKILIPTIGKPGRGAATSAPDDIHARRTFRGMAGCVTGTAPLFADGRERMSNSI